MTEKDIVDFVTDHYYCDEINNNGERILWEPFECYLKENVDKFINSDIISLKQFIETHFKDKR